MTDLYVTNSNSDNLTTLKVDRKGFPNPVTPPVATGTGPSGIVFTPDGKSAYVLNRRANTVSAYAVDQDGALRPLSTVGTQGKTPMGIVVGPNGRTLYVSNITSGTLTAFGINPDGTLTRLGPPVRDAADSRGLAISPDGRFLFVGHGLPNASPTDAVTTYAIGHGGGLRAVGDPVPAGGAGSGMSVSPDGRFLYVASMNADAVFAFRIGPEGALDPLPGSPFPVADYPEGSALTADGRYLYITSPGSDRANPGHSISAFAVGADGDLTPVAGSPFTAGDGPAGMAITPDERNLYVANFDSSTISAFTITPTGALREVNGSPIASGGERPVFQSVAVRPTMAR